MALGTGELIPGFEMACDDQIRQFAIVASSGVQIENENIYYIITGESRNTL